MENSEAAHHLIEIQSLLNKISFHKKNIEKNLLRPSSIKNQRDKTQQRLEEVHELIASVEKTFNDEDKQLQKDTKDLENKDKQKNLVTTEKELSAIEHDIRVLEGSISILEEKALKNLESKEELENEEKDLSSFLNGSLKSLQDIEKEVLEANKLEQNEIDLYEARVEGIISSLPPSMGKEFKSLMDKFENDKPLSFLKNGCCGQCHYSIPRTVEEALQKSFSLEYCPNCNRVLIPENVPH
jgi:predicted  nucleic acid-binding Zn-ribbon protein